MYKNLCYVADFFANEEDYGGAAMVDKAIMDRLNKKFDFVSYKNIKPIKNDTFYIIANRSLFPRDYLNSFKKNQYIVIEHDSQFDKGRPGTNGRNPYMYNAKGIVPDEFKQDLDFYKKARKVFLQTDFHKKLFEDNNIQGNLESLKSTIFSTDDFKLIKSVNNENIIPNRKYCIVNSNVWLKGTPQAIQFCEENNLEFDLINPNKNRKEFFSTLAKYSTLVFFPLSPESCCRLVMEAKMLGLNVITTKNYGASTSEWFKLTGNNLISEIENLNLKSISIIEESLC